MHTSPLAQPGAGDSGGMNVYVRELVSALAQAGVRADVLRAPLARRPARGGRRRARLPGRAHRGRAARPGQGEAARGGGRVHRRRSASTSRRGPTTRTPSTPTTGCPAWRATGSSTSCRCLWCRPSTPWPGSRPRPATPSRPDGCRPRPRSSGAPTPSWPPVEAEATQLVELYGAAPERIEIVPPGVDHAFFSPGDQGGARQALRLGDHPGAAVRGPHPAAQGGRRGRAGPGRAATARTAMRCWWSWGAPAARTVPAEETHLRQLVDELGLAGAVRFVAAPAPPPAVDLLPGGRRVRRAQSLGVLRAGRPGGGRLRHPGGGGRGRRAGHAGRPRAHRLSWSRAAIPQDYARFASTRVLTDPDTARALAHAAAGAGRDYRWSTAAARLRRVYADLTARALVECRVSRPEVPAGLAGRQRWPGWRRRARSARDRDRRLAGRAAGREPGGRRGRPG